MRITQIPTVGVALLTFGMIFVPVRWRVLAQDTRVGDSSVPDVRIGVFGLFHPIELTVSAPAGSALVVRASEQGFVLEKSSGVDSAVIRISNREIVVTSGSDVVRATEFAVTGRKGEPVDFILAIPEKITRHYHGILKIKPSAGSLIAIVTMDRETAIASVLAAESMPERQSKH